jgi:tricarballylate dehydrogenase
MKQGYDVVVAGAGNAAFCAALAARERVGRVLMLEKAPPAWIGGNTYFTAGAFRTTFSDVEDLSPILDDVAEEQLARTELPPYTEDDFVADMNRVTEDCCDDELTNILASEAADAVRWLHGKGIRWRLMYDRQSFEVGGKRRFWGGWSSERWAEAEGSYNSTSPRLPGAVSKFGASAR